MKPLTTITIEARPEGRITRLLRGLPRAEMLISLANQALISGMTFIIGIAVARHLGIAEFGRLAFVLILQAFAQYLQGYFVVSPMMSLAGSRASRSNNYYAAVMAWSVLLAVIAGLAVTAIVGGAYGIRDGVVPWNLALAAGALTSSQNLLFCGRRMLFANGLGGRALLTDTLRYALFAAALFAVWRGGSSIDVAMVLWALAASGLVIFGPLWLRLAGARVDRRIMSAVLARHLPVAKWLALMLLLVFSQEQIIALGLGLALSDAALGGLRAGQYLIGTTHFIWVALENFVPKSASRAYAEGGLAAMRAVLTRTMLMFGALVWGIILAVSVPAEWSLRLAFGPGYEQFAPILRLYALTYAIAFVREIWVYYFYPIERTDIVFRAYVMGFIAAAIVFYPALKLMGITGAAMTVLIANSVSTGFVLYNAWRGADRKQRAGAA